MLSRKEILCLTLRRQSAPRPSTDLCIYKTTICLVCSRLVFPPHFTRQPSSPSTSSFPSSSPCLTAAGCRMPWHPRPLPSLPPRSLTDQEPQSRRWTSRSSALAASRRLTSHRPRRCCFPRPVAGAPASVLAEALAPAWRRTQPHPSLALPASEPGRWSRSRGRWEDDTGPCPGRLAPGARWAVCHRKLANCESK